MTLLFESLHVVRFKKKGNLTARFQSRSVSNKKYVGYVSETMGSESLDIIAAII